jgi:hypothetical protein
LPELIIEGVDNEQIYQQLQIHNNSAYNSLMKYFAKCLSKPGEITFNIDMKGTIDRINKKKLEKKRQEDLEYDDETTEEEDDEIGDDALVEDLTIKETKKNKNKPIFGIPDGSDRFIYLFVYDVLKLILKI